MSAGLVRARLVSSRLVSARARALGASLASRSKQALYRQTVLSLQAPVPPLLRLWTITNTQQVTSARLTC